MKVGLFIILLSYIHIYIIYIIHIYNKCINFVWLNMKISNKNIFKKIFFKKTSYILVCSKNFLRLYTYIYYILFIIYTINTY